MKNYLNRCNNNYDLFASEDPFFSLLFDSKPTSDKIMRSDVKELKDSYLIEVEVPGIDKKDIKISLENEYLTITATKEKEEETEKVHYLSKERYTGTYSRSFYVGQISQEAIKASFKDGVLAVSIPKSEYNKEEEKKYIAID